MGSPRNQGTLPRPAVGSAVRTRCGRPWDRGHPWDCGHPWDRGHLVRIWDRGRLARITTRITKGRERFPFTQTLAQPWLLAPLRYAGVASGLDFPPGGLPPTRCPPGIISGKSGRGRTTQADRGPIGCRTRRLPATGCGLRPDRRKCPTPLRRCALSADRMVRDAQPRPCADRDQGGLAPGGHRPKLEVLFRQGDQQEARSYRDGLAGRLP